MPRVLIVGGTLPSSVLRQIAVSLAVSGHLPTICVAGGGDVAERPNQRLPAELIPVRALRHPDDVVLPALHPRPEPHYRALERGRRRWRR